MSDCTLKVVAPAGYDVFGLLEEKRLWIHGHIKKRQALLEKCREKSSKLLVSGDLFSVCPGESCFFDYEEMTVYYTSVHDLKVFFKKRLGDVLDIRVGEIADEMEVSCSGFSIRCQRSRWASCSSSGRLSFNIRIYALPPRLRDYIIIHELAHITEHNHSKNFWRIVEEFCPDYRDFRGELSEYWTMIEENAFWKAMLN